MPKLWQELGKTKPFENPPEDTYVQILRTAAIFTSEVTRLLKPHRLSDTTYNILRILRGAGSAGRSCSQIGQQVVSLVPDVTRLVDTLQRRGLAQRMRTARDRRMVLVRITPAGLKLLKKVDPLLAQWHEQHLRHMTSAHIQQLNSLLERARAPATS